MLFVTVGAMDERLAWHTDHLPFGVNYDPATGRVFVQDFASIFELTKAAVSGAIAAPYSVAGQLEFMDRWVGQPIDGALGYGYSPTLWLLLAPLLPVPAWLAYLLWTLLPALAVVWIGWRLVADGWGERNPIALSLILAAFISGSYQGLVHLGQTAVVLGLLTVWLMREASAPGKEGRIGFLLFLTTAKPPLALAIGLGLLWNRRIRPLLIALGLVAVEVACVTAWLGPGWISDYLALLTHYTSETAPEAFRSFLGPAGMSNLRHLLVTGAGWNDRAAATASLVAWAVAAVWGTWLVRRGRLPAGPLRGAFALLLYLMLCPHLTFTNDLMVLIVAWFLDAEGDLDRPTRIALLATLAFIVNAGPFKLFLSGDGGADLVFLAKIGILIPLLAGRVKPALRGGPA